MKALTDDQVTQIRTSGFTDNYWARRLRTTNTTVRHARQGKRYQHVATPPDLAPREGTGRLGTLNPKARPKRQRRQWP